MLVSLSRQKYVPHGTIWAPRNAEPQGVTCELVARNLEPTSRDKQHCKMADIGILLRPPHAAIFLVLLAWIPRIANSNERKNVLVIIGDDAGFETQVYDNTVCKTPNLNALGKRSVIFRKAFTSVSSCSPSRSAILTGKF